MGFNRYGMIGTGTIGCYRTPDGQGHVERAGKEWHAWRDDRPGITAVCDTMREAAQYAHHGDAID